MALSRLRVRTRVDFRRRRLMVRSRGPETVLWGGMTVSHMSRGSAAAFRASRGKCGVRGQLIGRNRGRHMGGA